MPGLTRKEKQFREENPVELLEREKKLHHTRKSRTWDEFFQVLTVYKERHGDCEVLQRYKEDRPLGAWVGNQRKDCAKLSSQQRTRLDSLGFDWSTRQERDERTWNEKLARLKVFRLEYGDCRIPQQTKDDAMQPWVDELGKWVSHQRETFKNGKLCAEKIAKLEWIGFEWTLKQKQKNRENVKADEKWHMKYNELVDFQRQHGHCIVPCFYEDRSLGDWVGKQRQAYASGRLTNERKQLLNDLNFV